MWIEHFQEKNEKKGLAKKNTRKEKKNMNLKQIFRKTNKTKYIYIYTSRFASSSCGGPPVAKRPASFATHAQKTFEDFKQHYSLKTKPSVKKTASGSLKITSEAAWTRPIIFSIKSYPCMPKSGSHSIQGMAGHSGQTHKQTNSSLLC